MTKTWIPLISGIISLVQLIKHIRRHNFLKKLLNILKGLQETSPTELAKHLQKLEEYGLCRGQLSTETAIRSILTPNVEVIASKLSQIFNAEEKNIISTGVKTIQTNKASMIKLQDSLIKIKVLETRKVIFQWTEKIIKNYSNSKSTIREWLEKLEHSLKKLLRQPIYKQFCEEQYLPNDSMGLIFGKFQKTKTGEVLCENPYYIAQNKSFMIDFLLKKVKKNNIYTLLSLLAFSIAVGAFAYIATKQIKEAYLNYKMIKERRDKIEVKSRVCLNCKENPAIILNNKCQHLDICNDCYKEGDLTCKRCTPKDSGHSVQKLYLC